MKYFISRIFILIGYFPIILACGGPNDSKGSPGGTGGSSADIPESGPIERMTMPAAVAQALCDAIERCECDWRSSSPCTTRSICPDDYQDCLSKVASVYASADQLALDAGYFEYRPDEARACVTFIQTASCESMDYINFCTRMWQGTQEMGGECTHPRQCKDGAVCSNEGICIEETAPTKGTTGADCELNSSCESGLACVEGSCQRALTLGSSCMWSIINESCEAGAYCNSATNVCEEQKNHGAACVFSEECRDGQCEDEICYAFDAVCQAPN